MKVTEFWPRELLPLFDYISELIARKVAERMSTKDRPSNQDVRTKLRTKSRSNAARFAAALVDNEIPGVQLRAALARDVHRAYVAWCVQAGESHVEPINRLLPLIKGKRARKRWELRGRRAGPHSVVFLVSPPRGLASEAHWLGEQIEEFEAAVRAFEDTLK